VLFAGWLLGSWPALGGQKSSSRSRSKQAADDDEDSEDDNEGETSKVDESSECPICLDLLSQGTLCTLPCKHEFHRKCVEELRKHGVLQACPLCRADLPDGPEKLFDDAVRIYISLDRKVESGKASWLSLTAPQKSVMSEVVAMWTSASNQGHVQAQHNLGVVYENGQGVKQDFKEGAKGQSGIDKQLVKEMQRLNVT
jgi:hypothetical protein